MKIPDPFASLQESSKVYACYLHSSQQGYINKLSDYYSVPGTFRASTSKNVRKEGIFPSEANQFSRWLEGG